MHTKSKIILLSLFTVFFALLIDLSLSFFVTNFRYTPHEGKLNNYLSYGASTYRKLIYNVGTDNEEAKNIAKAGWNESIPVRHPSFSEICKKVTIYGMSFTNHIANKIENINPCISIRRIAGPGATLSHSYYMYERFHKDDDSEVIVLGILASALPKMTAMASFNSGFETSASYIYPRYYVQNGELRNVPPPAKTLNELRKALLDEKALEQLLKVFREYDEYYSDLVFNYASFDNLNSLRMLRRAYGQKRLREQIGSYYSNGEFSNKDHLRETAIKILEQFVVSTRSQGKYPLVILINDRGYAMSLDKLLLPSLKSMNVSYLSSSEVIDSEDMSNFMSDGHFTEKNDAILASEVLNRVENF